MELDFSWNELTFVPVPQMRRLALLRRLSFRGNPLGQLNDLTLAGGLWSGQQLARRLRLRGAALVAWWLSFSFASPPDRADLLAGQVGEQAGHKLANMSRLLESFPELFLAAETEEDLAGAQSLAVEQLADEPEREALIWLLKNRHSLERELALEPTDEGGEESTAEGLPPSLDSGADNEEATGGKTDALAADSQGHTDANWVQQIGSEGAQKEREEEQGRRQERRHWLVGGVKDLQLSQFEHLQELDFGQCKLLFIQWSVLANLNSLKKLFLDGNHLR